LKQLDFKISRGWFIRNSLRKQKGEADQVLFVVVGALLAQVGLFVFWIAFLIWFVLRLAPQWPSNNGHVCFNTLTSLAMFPSTSTTPGLVLELFFLSAISADFSPTTDRSFFG